MNIQSVNNRYDVSRQQSFGATIGQGFSNKLPVLADISSRANPGSFVSYLAKLLEGKSESSPGRAYRKLFEVLNVKDADGKVIPTTVDLSDGFVPSITAGGKELSDQSTPLKLEGNVLLQLWERFHHAVGQENIRLKDIADKEAVRLQAEEAATVFVNDFGL